jgi:hypothetical protein
MISLLDISDTFNALSSDIGDVIEEVFEDDVRLEKGCDAGREGGRLWMTT